MMNCTRGGLKFIQNNTALFVVTSMASLQSSISSALILGSQQEENPQQAQAINKYELLGVKVTKGASMKDERFENVPSQVSKK